MYCYLRCSNSQEEMKMLQNRVSKFCVIGAVAACVSSVAFAAPATKPVGRSAKSAAKSAKVVDVPFCVMDQMAMHKGMGATQVMGNHRMYFCSAAERKQFNTLPAKERQKKITAVLKKQQTANRKR